ncbi:unnamed protein product [Rotaria sordida]|uniref:Uncharacterized protein n=1 Tax=Rotaria sordida TaxID=392033 RepID=A0A813VX91_9BILA|nr:unnamed protein product [Rotaria sordida]CAF0889404.1 unnamed protein product [Rotaria sordida]CAF0890512.1 unnamed protein product [Rotaria sordida]CAF1108921.1 unnamed protein product [Rotaria sordida]CAF3901368.1 unnamed protein product [Rotaria sordida]
MPPQTKYAVPPLEVTGFRIFVRTSYAARYNFAVANYNAVSVIQKSTMFGNRLFLFRSIVAVVWIISMAFAILTLLLAGLVAVTIILSLIYIAISIYNIYVFIQNGNLLRSARLLRAKVAGPSGHDYEWVSVPLDSRSANERLASVEQASLDNVRREFGGNNNSEIDCMVYTKRYADSYPSFPKELLLHLIAFILAIIVGITIVVVKRKYL